MNIKPLIEQLKLAGLDNWLELNGYFHYPKEVAVFLLKLDGVDIGCYSWKQFDKSYSRVLIINKDKDNIRADLEELAKEIVKRVKEKYGNKVEYEIKL